MQTCYLQYSGHAWPHPPIIIASPCRKLWCLSASKISILFLTSSLRYFKDITNLLLWVLWVCLAKPTKNDSINLQKIFKQKFSSISHFFLEALHLKNPAIWLDKSISAHISGTWFFPDMGFVQENRKSTFLVDQIQKKFFLIKFRIPFKNIVSVMHHFERDSVKFQKKTNDPIQRKRTERQTVSRNDLYNTYVIALYM